MIFGKTTPSGGSATPGGAGQPDSERYVPCSSGVEGKAQEILTDTGTTIPSTLSGLVTSFLDANIEDYATDKSLGQAIDDILIMTKAKLEKFSNGTFTVYKRDGTTEKFVGTLSEILRDISDA